MKSVTAPTVETRPDEQATIKITYAILAQFYLPALEEACQSTFQNKVAFAIAKNHGYAQSAWKKFQRMREQEVLKYAELDKDGKLQFEDSGKGEKTLKFATEEARKDYLAWYEETANNDLLDMKVQRVDMQHFNAIEGNIRAATLIHLGPMFLPDEEQQEEVAVTSTSEPTPAEADVQP